VPRHTVFSSESVTAGHPDKICDQISDGIVDAFLYHDPGAEVSAECAVATGLVFLAVNSVSSTSVDITGVARQVIADIGYSEAYGFDPDTCSVVTSVSHRSQVRGDGARAEGGGSDEGVVATNQASVFGFACLDTSERMPLPITLARGLAQRLDEVRRDKTLPYLAPDGKTLVAVELEDRRPVRIHTVIVSVQHTAALGGYGSGGRTRLEADLLEAVIAPVLAGGPIGLDGRTKILINPGGAFLVGGPQRDAGLTGRKNMVDTYGGYARHGGGALSGKDPSHIDRLGAYVARYVARNLVAAELARQCEVHLSYALGEAAPLAVSVEAFGTGAAPPEVLERAVTDVIDLRVAAVAARFGLRQLPAQRGGSFYRQLAAYGHFGRPDLDLPWEREDQGRPLARAVRSGGVGSR
jgi:S-adenosylmethionine synthetase